MNTVIQSERAQIKRELSKQSTVAKRDKLKAQHQYAKKKRTMRKTDSSSSGSSDRSRKISKKYDANFVSRHEFGAKNVCISESSMIDFSILSESINDNEYIEARPKRNILLSNNRAQSAFANQSNTRLGALKKLNDQSKMQKNKESYLNSGEKQIKKSVNFQEDYKKEQNKKVSVKSQRSNSVKSGGILKNKNAPCNQASQKQIELRNQRLEKSAAKNRRRQQSNASSYASASSDESSISEESRQIELINQCKKAAEQAVQQKIEQSQKSSKKSNNVVNKRARQPIVAVPENKEKDRDESPNWFVNLFSFCGTCSSKSNVPEKKNVESGYEQADKKTLSLEDSLISSSTNKRNSANSKLQTSKKESRVSGVQPLKNGRYSAEDQLNRQKVESTVTTEMLNFSIMSIEEPKHLDMKKLKQQSQAEKVASARGSGESHQSLVRLSKIEIPSRSAVVLKTNRSSRQDNAYSWQSKQPVNRNHKKDIIQPQDKQYLPDRQTNQQAQNIKMSKPRQNSRKMVKTMSKQDHQDI